VALAQAVQRRSVGRDGLRAFGACPPLRSGSLRPPCGLRIDPSPPARYEKTRSRRAGGFGACRAETQRRTGLTARPAAACPPLRSGSLRPLCGLRTDPSPPARYEKTRSRRAGGFGACRAETQRRTGLTARPAAACPPLRSGSLRPLCGLRTDPSPPARYEKTRSRRAFSYLAGGEGFEPPLTESESVVLPLDDPPGDRFRKSRDT
jgi:hypothetical protein